MIAKLSVLFLFYVLYQLAVTSGRRGSYWTPPLQFSLLVLVQWATLTVPVI